MQDVLLIAAGLAALFFGGKALVRGASRLATSFGISPTVVALTIVAVGTSVPELLVSVNAAQQGNGLLALGNILGSNIANIGLILGLSAVIAPMLVERQLVRREIPLLMIGTIVGFLLARDGELSRVEGGLMVVGFVGFIGLSYARARKENHNHHPEPDAQQEDISRKREAIRVVIACVLLAVGSEWTVSGATSVAESLGISDFIIGLTLVAVGTALPELSASVIAAWRKQPDIIVGSVIGSNISNVLLILGATAVVEPVPIDADTLRFQYPAVVGFTLLLGVFFFDPLLRRWEGAVLLLGYAAFLALLFLG